MDDRDRRPPGPLAGDREVVGAVAGLGARLGPGRSPCHRGPPPSTRDPCREVASASSTAGCRGRGWAVASIDRGARPGSAAPPHSGGRRKHRCRRREPAASRALRSQPPERIWSSSVCPPRVGDPGIDPGVARGEQDEAGHSDRLRVWGEDGQVPAVADLNLSSTRHCDRGCSARSRGECSSPSSSSASRASFSSR